jgi:hypothetical protein
MSDLTFLSSNPAAIAEDAALFAATRTQWLRRVAVAKAESDDAGYGRLMDERLAFMKGLAASFDSLSPKAKERVNAWSETLE